MVLRKSEFAVRQLKYLHASSLWFEANAVSRLEFIRTYCCELPREHKTIHIGSYLRQTLRLFGGPLELRSRTKYSRIAPNSRW
jgi:hypothetical protein